jgi:phenylacetate-coenzyme A ligase PaaK-like adenylate-forming protein
VSGLDRARGTLTILRRLRGQLRVPYLPSERVRELRDRRVRATVRYAAAHVPYYRELFRAAGIEPTEIRTASDLERLPFLDKETVRAQQHNFRSPLVEQDDGLWLSTAGARTGTPLDVFHDRASLLALIAFAERERVVEARFCGRRYRYSAIDIRFGGAEIWKVQTYFARHSFRPLRPSRHGLSVDTPFEEVLDTIDRVRPDVVRSYGSYLEALSRFVEAHGANWDPPSLLVYAGDALPPAARSEIEQRLGAPLISRYGASESPKIGYLCEQRAGFHLYEDLCHVEIVGPHGRPCPDGEQGEVAITNLVNRGTILIRYRLEDLARLTTEPCPCGRTGPRLAEIDGRVGYFLRLPDGRHIHGYTVWDVVHGIKGLLRFQLAQLEHDRFVLRLQPTDGNSFEPARVEALPRLRKLLPGCRVEVEEAAELGPDANGKYRWVVPLP